MRRSVIRPFVAAQLAGWRRLRSGGTRLVAGAAILAGPALLAVGPAQASGTLGPATIHTAAALASSGPGSGPRLTTNTRAGCNAPPRKGFARCYAVVRTPASHDIAAAAVAGQPPSGALGPADIQAAYNLPATGSGQTVAIVDASGDSQAEG
ncbi:MAG TPA: hypothetical protein VF834_14575 [Streptosporangiaceae bacterium]